MDNNTRTTEDERIQIPGDGTTPSSAIRPDARSAWLRSAWRVSLIAAIFATIVFCLLVANAISSRRLDPAKPVRLDALQIELNKDRNNAPLRAEVLQLDREIRTSYFRSRAFAESGLYLLLGGLAVFLLSVEVGKKLRRAIPAPRPSAPREFWMGVASSNRPVIGLGTALGGVLLLLVVLSRHDAGAEYARAAMRPPEERPAASGEPQVQRQALTGDRQTGSSFAPLVSALQPSPISGGTAPAAEPGARDTVRGLQPIPVATAPVLPGPAPTSASSRSPLAAALVRRGMLVGAAHPQAWGSNWPIFRGPSGTGMSASSPEPGARAPESPITWDAPAGKGIVWKANVPLPGWNSPVIWGKRLFIAGGDKAQREVYCFDTGAGALLWRKAVALPKPAPGIKVNQDTGYAPSTMAVDGKHACIIFPSGDVACLDFAGKLLWQRNLGVPANSYGHASSLTLYANGLIVQLDQGTVEEGKSALLALNVETGKTIWEVKRPVPASWSTPVVVHAGDRDELVTCGDPWVIAYDPRSGEEIWRASCLHGDVVPSVVTASGMVIAGVYGADLVAIRPGLTGDVTKSSIAWKYPDDLPDIASPTTDGERIYLAAGGGSVTCLDPKTGHKLWDHDFRTQFHASPVVAGGKVYLVDSDGVTYVLEAGPALKQLSKNPLREPVFSTPAILGGRIYLRGKQFLYCIGAK